MSYAESVLGILIGENVPAALMSVLVRVWDEAVSLPIVVARSFTVRADHGADIDTRTYVSHLTISISSGAPESSLSRKLLAVGIKGINLLEIRLREVDKVVFKEVVHGCA